MRSESGIVFYERGDVTVGSVCYPVRVGLVNYLTHHPHDHALGYKGLTEGVKGGAQFQSIKGLNRREKAVGLLVEWTGRAWQRLPPPTGPVE